MRVVMPLPDTDFDTTEVAVPWRLLRDAGHEIVFATEGGSGPPACDPRLLTGVIFDALVLAGGHAPGMRQYLGSSLLQQRVADFWSLERPVGAICHGVLVLAR